MLSRRRPDVPEIIARPEITWSDDWVKRAKPQRAGGAPRPLSSASMQYSTRQAPGRGVAELLESYRESAWLRAVIDKIGWHFAIVPWQLHERPDKTGKRMQARKFQNLRGIYRQKSISNALRTGELREIDQHPLLELLSQPNTEMGGVAFRDLSCKFVDFAGECFHLVVRDSLGIPYQLWPIVPTWVIRIPSAETPSFDLSILGSSMRIPKEDVLYIRRHELLNPYARGAGLGAALADTIDMDRYAHKFLKSTYFNGARPDMIVSLPGASEDVIADFQQKWENQTRGALRAHRTFFADSEIDVNQLENKVGIEQSIPLLNHTRDTFVSVFGVPPEIMGILENANRATINQAMTIFARETLMPRLELFADEWQRQLVPLFDDKLLLSFTNPVPEDDDFRLEVAQAAPWSLSNREWRQLGNWPNPADQKEFYMVPLGVTSVADPSQSVLAPGQPGMKPPAAPAAPAVPAEPAAKAVSRLVTKGADDEDAEGMADDVLSSFEPDYLVDELDPLWQASVDEWGQQALADLGIDASFDLQNPRVKEHLAKFAGERIDGMNETTQAALKDALVEGFRAGENYRQIAARVKDVMGTNTNRAEKIARTEVARSSNFASTTAYRQSGVIEQKQWVSTVSDDRTRDAHVELNGQVVGIDEPFEVDGAEADYPGDFDDPGLSINCRCVVSPVVDEPKSLDQLSGIWKAYDGKAKSWEDQAASAVIKAFQKQQKPVLRALYRMLHN